MIYVSLLQFNSLTTTKNVLSLLLIVFKFISTKTIQVFVPRRFFFSLRGLYEIQKHGLVTFKIKFQLMQQDKNLQCACGLPITFNTYQKYLSL